MSDAERRRWDERYRDGSYGGRRHPTRLLAEWEAQLPRGRVLDVACGAGRNSLFLAAAGWEVDGIDISTAGLERAREAAAEQELGICWIEADLDGAGEVLPPGPYDLIVLVRYVNRTLVPHLVARLAHGGVLLYEQHVETTDDVIGPKNPAFRLRHNELLRSVMDAAEPGDRLLYYREGTVMDPDGRRAALAQLVLRRERSLERDDTQQDGSTQ